MIDVAFIDVVMCVAWVRRSENLELLICGGAEGARTPDPRLAKAVLSQLSYSPTLSEVLDGFTRMPRNILAQFGAKKQRGRLSLLKASTPCYIAGV